MAVVTPNWKYIHWYYGAGMMPTEELFDLSKDRYEMNDAVSDTKNSAMLAS